MLKEDLPELWLVADELTQINPLSDTSVFVWFEEGSEGKKTQRNRVMKAPWKQLKPHKMEFVSALPKLSDNFHSSFDQN